MAIQGPLGIVLGGGFFLRRRRHLSRHPHLLLRLMGESVRHACVGAVSISGGLLAAAGVIAIV